MTQDDTADGRQADLEQVLDSFARRRADGEQISREQLLVEHPELAEELARYFAAAERQADTSDATPGPTIELDAPQTAAGSVGVHADATVAWGADAGRARTGARRLTDANRQFGDYELLEEIARGGMGVVYKARQVRLNRLVAIKMILAGQFATDRDVERFYTEAQAAANLRHPHIVAIHEVGEHDGQHFFSMDYVEGQSLSALVKDHPLPSRMAADFVQTIAEAIEHAHEQGILHRDLKPSNVLVDRANQPRVTDFGLARRIEGDSQLTATGTVVGTPSYMPPEQAAGKRGAMGPASDVYSLGAMLYELLTARPPFQAATSLDTMLQVLHNEPVAPRLLNRAVDRDVETICLKCLQKDPRRRYASAQELADDLKRYGNHEPILARPIGRAERVWRWCRRNPIVAFLTAMIATLLVAAAAGALAVANRERGLREAADVAKTEAQQNADESRRRLVRQLVANGVRHIDDRDLLGSLPWLVEALRLDEGEGQLEAVHRLRLAAVLQQAVKPAQVWFHADRVMYAEFDGDGKRVITACADQTARLWDTETGAPIGPALKHAGVVAKAAFSPDGTLAATASTDGTARIWNASSGEAIGAPLGHKGPVTDVCFSPDGRLLATASADKTARLWRAATGEPVGEPLVHGFGVSQVSFSPDGRLLAAACGEQVRGYRGKGEARVWDTSSGRAVGAPLSHDGAVRSVAFSPDSTRLVTGSDDFLAQVWDAASGRQALAPVRHINIVTHALFSPDGKRLATACDDASVRVWDTETGQILTAPLEHLGEVKQLAFSPDGRWVATASYYGAAQVWDVASGRPVVGRLEHAGPVDRVRFSPDGHRIVTACRDGTARVWDLAAGEPAPLRFAQRARIRMAVFSPDGRRVATAGDDLAARVWDAKDGKPVSPPLEHKAVVLHAAFSPDGRELATTSEDRTVRIWNAQTGKQRGADLEHGGKVYHAAFSPDGSRLVTACEDGTARLWDAATLEPLGQAMKHEASVQHADFSPDGRHVVTASRDGSAQVWDARTGKTQGPRVQHTIHINWAAFSPDGRLLVTAGGEGLGEGGGEANVWDAKTGQLVAGPFPHSHGVPQAVFSPDSSRVATASYDDTARIWQAMGGTPLTPPMKHAANVNTVAFSPDGTLLLTASSDFTARVWDAATGEAVTPPLMHPHWCQLAAFSPDGRGVLTVNMDESARVWRLPRETRKIDELARLSEALSGRRLYEDSGVVELEPAEFRSRWNEVARNGSGFAGTSEQVEAWHERAAQECLMEGQQHFARAWHLGKLIELHPDSLSLYYQRSESHAELGDWQRAAADFAKLEGAIQVTLHSLRTEALFHLARGNTAGYREACRKLAGALGATQDPGAINAVLWCCVLAPHAVEDLRPLVQAADKLLAGHADSHALLNTAGAVSYRAGDNAAAIERLKAGLRTDASGGTAFDWLLLAMAEHRQGNHAEARQWFEKADEWIERETNERTRGTVASLMSWQDRLELQLLHGEAMLVLATRAGKTTPQHPAQDP